MRNWWKKKWFLFVVVIVLLEIAASVFNPYRHIPKANIQTRNQIAQSGWPEYLDIPQKDNKHRIILIGNSQAVGYEMRDSSKTYFGILRDSLSQNNPDLDLQNWSTGGVRMAEMQILTAKAITEGADRIVYAIHADNFDLAENVNLNYIDSDVKLLLSEKDVFHLVEKMQLGQQISFIDRFNAWMERNIGLLRWRQYLLNQSTILTREEDDVFWYGNTINDGQVIDFERFPKLYEDYLSHWHRDERLSVRMDDLDTNFAISRLQSFIQFENQLDELSKQYGFKYEFIWTPYHQPAYSKATREIVDHYFIEPSLSVGNHVTNLIYSIDSTGFLSRAHFNAQGHKQFALQLLKHWKDDF